MKCNEVNAALNAYVDGELSSAQMQQVDEHLRSCANCSEEYRDLNDFKNTINYSEIYDSAPAHLKEQVSTSLKEIENSNFSGLGFPAVFAYSIPALLLGLVIGWAAMSQFDTEDTGDNLLESLTSAHIHSLMANHLVDIASSDSHTVKPWFHGQLDFSPPVHDLTQQGYPLLGGRLEYLAKSSAAALIYRHRQHTINLFIRPKSLQAINVGSAEYNGYHIFHWNDESLSYWAVSDLNLSDLNNFKELLIDKTS